MRRRRENAADFRGGVRKNMSNKKSKNVSKKVKNGTIIHTRDEYFEGQKNYKKPGYEKKGNYRLSAVLDTNRDDHMALVKLTTSSKAKKVNEKSGFRAYIETKDERGNPIKISGRFIPDKTGKSLSKRQVNEIKKDCVTDPKTGGRNRKKLKGLKGRK